MEIKQPLYLALQQSSQDQGVNLDVTCDLCSVITEPNVLHQRQGRQHSNCSSFPEQSCQCGTALPLGVKEQFNSHHYPLGLVCWGRVPSSDAFWSGSDLPNPGGLEQQCVTCG